MKEKVIKLIGKQITENSEELEEGYVEIEVNVEDTLNEFDSEDVLNIAKWYDWKHKDDFKSDIDDFNEKDLIEKLQDDGYDFTQQLNEEQCIDFLEEKGYKIDVATDADDLNIIDQKELTEIINMYKSVCF